MYGQHVTIKGKVIQIMNIQEIQIKFNYYQMVDYHHHIKIAKISLNKKEVYSTMLTVLVATTTRDALLWVDQA